MDLQTGTETLLARTEGGIGWLTFNNPARHNALSVEMLLAVPIALAAFEAQDDVRVVVISGAGGRAFVSGADISEFGEKRTSPEARADYDRATGVAWRSWSDVTKPVLAMIQGYCVGGGVMTAMQADIRICSEDSQFGIPAARLGLGGVEQLTRLVGPAAAADILFSGRRLPASEALRVGLVNQVVATADLEASVRQVADQIAANAPLTVAACKAAIREAVKDPHRRDLAPLEAMVEACFRSQDYLEGQRAFLEKRPPQFQGR
ncbi:MAG: enoyl-CoA hydratase [Acidimicrobiia bacterium]|nr:enoyl-CoA hydratase [Acidimicrobiia bacterium]